MALEQSGPLWRTQTKRQDVYGVSDFYPGPMAVQAYVSPPQ